MRSLATVLGLCVLVLALGSCGQKVSEIKIGEYGSMTGQRATFGTSSHRGIEMAIDEANAAGGIGGTPIRLISEDDQGKPEEAATAVNKLISQDRVVAVLGEVASSASLAGAPVCQKNGVPMITPSSTNEKVTQVGDYIFRICYIDPFQGMVMARFAAQSLRLNSAAILRDKRNDYSIGLANVFSETFKSLGGTVPADESYQEGDMDFRAPLTAILSSNPQALFVPGYYTEVGLVARQARELGFTGPMLGGDGWVSESLFQIAGKQLEGCYFSNHYAQDDPNPIVQQFISRYKERYKEVPDAMSALGYDAARILVHSLKQMQKTQPEAVAALLATSGNDEASRGKRAEGMKTLRDMIAATRDFPGVTGSITIDENRNAIKPIVVLKVHDNSLVLTERIAP
jgi:branched-chain amino acid transport system substrate-binding protein